MAASTRLLLRSSARNKNTSLEEVPPTDIQQNPLPNTRRGKRGRDSSPGSASNASVKKQKAKERDDTLPKAVRSEVQKSLPIRDRSSTDAVTQVGRSRRSEPPVQEQQQHQPVNGSITAAQNAQSFANNKKFSINTNGTTNTNGNGAQPEKRSLRSQAGGSRSKSELALYFTNYDELVSIEPKEPGESIAY